MPGARETLDALKADGMRLAVISGTLDLLLDALFPDHPFDEVYTNRITFREDGTIAGWWATPFDMEGKGGALRAIAARQDVPLSRCAFVGDHANDLSAFRLAGLALAFNPKNDEVAAAAHAVVRFPRPPRHPAGRTGIKGTGTFSACPRLSPVPLISDVRCRSIGSSRNVWSGMRRGSDALFSRLSRRDS